LSRTVLKQICLVVEKVSATDLETEPVRQFVIELIYFLGVVAGFLRIEANIEAALAIYHSFLCFLTVLRMGPTLLPVEVCVRIVRVLSQLTLLSDEIVISIDHRKTAILVHTLKVFIGLENYILAPVLHELIVLYGLLCGRSGMVKESCCWLPPPTLLDGLCGLPLSYFTQKPENSILLPTILACCIDSVENSWLVETAVNHRLLVRFIQEMPVNGADIASPHLRVPLNRRMDLIRFFSRP
jgi:hypothetical protein